MKTTLHREIETADAYVEVDIAVTFRIVGSYRPATRTDPAEEPELEVESAVRLDTGEEVDLTDDEEAGLWEAANEARRAAAEDRAEGILDARREAALHAWGGR